MVRYWKNPKIENALEKINKNKTKTSKDKAKETRLYIQRLGDMQLFIDKSSVKRKLLWKTIIKKDNDNIPLIKKGLIIYIERLEVLEIIKTDLEKKNIECKYVTSKVPQKERGQICKWFKDNPSNKVVLISACGGESLNLNATNEMILYNVPKGAGKFTQLIGRVDRSFGAFHEFNIKFIIIKNSIDEYMQILLSSKKELELEILTQDVIPIKEVTSFDYKILQKIRKDLLWKETKRKNK